MKKSALFLFPLLTAALMTGCSTDDDLLSAGEGSVSLSATLSSDVKVISRADGDELRDTYGPSLKLWLTRPGEGPVHTYDGIDNLPSGPVMMRSGQYVAEAWAGDSVAASRDKKYFKGYVPFEVTAGGATQVDVACKIANVLVSVEFDASVAEVLQDGYNLTAANGGGNLSWTDGDDSKGYFMMGKNETSLRLTIAGVSRDGKPFTQEKVLDGVKGGFEYHLTVRHTGTVDPAGGAWLDIVVDEREVVVEDEFTISLAPMIKGITFDINQPQAGEPGNMGRRCVYITASESLSRVELQGAPIEAIVGHDDVGLIQPDASYMSALKTAGINVIPVRDAEGRLTNMRINFEETFTSSLAKGTHEIKITAADNSDGEEKVSEATLVFDISDASIAVNPATNVSYTSATFNATLLKSDLAETPRFKYRATGTSAWQYADAVISGTNMTAAVSNLAAGTTYEYIAVVGDAEAGRMQTFTTLSYPQLPNCGFETWCTDANEKNVIIPGASPSNFFWDSGNHGSITMNKNITMSDGSVKHSGNYSAKLQSQFVGIGVMGRLAAGNIFIGKYLRTDISDGVLGWGRPFDTPVRPKAMKVWVKYEPVAVTHVVNDAQLSVSKGDMDTGIIYIALVDDTKSADGSEQWPFIIKTKKSERQLFDANAANVISYGEHVFTGATDGMIQVTIPLEDKHPSLVYANIVVVASASRYGDYFTGGDGSTMWIDDIELVY